MPIPTQIDPKVLYRQLDKLFGAFDPNRPQDKLLESFLEELFHALSEPLRLGSGHLYGEKRDGFELLKSVGDVPKGVPELLDPQVAPLAPIFKHRAYIFRKDPSDGMRGLLQGLDSAGIVVGRRPSRYVLFFRLGAGWTMEDLDFALNTVRVALGSRMLEGRVRGSFLQAAEIQQSLLQEDLPDFPGFELAGRSVATEEVGGDFYDFVALGEDLLGVAIGDASGHGLPAALLVRDVVTGLRMGLEKDLKVTHVFEKLNRVIHRSNLSSRFVSVFYGELESDGTLVYVNAGHQPPVLFSGERTIELAKGGTVIGPLPEARFKRGLARLFPNDTLVMCTDGILERRGRDGEFFGTETLKRVVLEKSHTGAQGILEGIFQSSFEHGQGRPWEDDATIVVVRRLPNEQATTPPKG
jgi:sigma-B regulation protein RsbU (phosphoserine phosphatase)